MLGHHTILQASALLVAFTAVHSEDQPIRSAVPQMNIVALGSSTVWGRGFLDDSFVAPIDRFVKSQLSQTVMPDDMVFSKDGKPISPTLFENRKQYDGEGYLLEGVGATLEFDLEGDELAICHTRRRTKNWGNMALYADGELIGSFSNRNETIGAETQSFRGDGKKESFDLGRPFTYNHRVSVDGRDIPGGLHVKSVYMRNDIFEYYPEDFGYVVVRKYSEEKPPQVVHNLLFREPPTEGAEVRVAYDYGETVCHTKSTVGEDTDDQIPESAFGMGTVSHDPAHPTQISSGLDFRYINGAAFFRQRFNSARPRHFKIVIEGGERPYFIIDFATNRYHNLMNAGIGGWTAKMSLQDKGLRSYKHAFTPCTPDIITITLGANDDWAEKERFACREIRGVTEEELKRLPTLELHSAKKELNGTFTVVKNTGLIETVDATSLVSPQLVGSDIKPGYFVRIGTYTGDNDSVAVRTILTVDPGKGRLTWEEPLQPDHILLVDKLSDLAGAEVSVRSLTGYGGYVRQLVAGMKALNPAIKIIILHTWNANYFTRQTWGYPQIQQIIEEENDNVYAIDAAARLQEFQRNAVSGKDYIEVDADGSPEYELPWEGDWQGYKVMVDGENVYGKTCYILTGRLWAKSKDKHGKELEFEGDYIRDTYTKRPQKLVFVRDAPQSGTIRIERADVLWSGDFAHPSQTGALVIGKICTDKLRELIPGVPKREQEQ